MSKPKPLVLSVSSYNLYTECGTKYFNEKVLGLSSIVKMSFLIFGTAVDKGCNALLANEGDPYDICNKELDRLLKEPFDFIPDDYDGELLDDEIKAKLLKKCQAMGSKAEDVDQLADLLRSRGYAGRNEVQNKAYSLLCHASLKEKARLAIDAYKVTVLPLITKVNSVQKEIKWKDELGNEFIGYLDMDIELKNLGDATGDNKTSGNVMKDFGPDSVRKSFQLAIYNGVIQRSKAAYFVMDKKIKKNRIKTCAKCENISDSTHKTCNVERPEVVDGKVKNVRCNGEWNHTIAPECKVTIIIDDIPAEQIYVAQKALTSAAEGIKAGAYPMNLNACSKTYGFGPDAKEVKCPFYDFCRNGSTEGLVKRERRK